MGINLETCGNIVEFPEETEKPFDEWDLGIAELFRKKIDEVILTAIEST